MSVDYYAIGTALATRMGSATAPSGTQGGTAIRQSTVIAPNNLTASPAVIIELPSGEIGVPMGQVQKSEHDFDAYFLLDWSSAGDERVRKSLLQWLGPLIDSTYSAVQLGLTVIEKAVVTKYEYGQYEYGGQFYPAWHLTVHVWVNATGVTFTA
jgi:hypothetical protein